MQVTVLYVGSSLLAPLKQAECELNRDHALGLTVAAYNFGAPLSDDVWTSIEKDLTNSEVVFAIHVMDGENAARLNAALDRLREQHRAVVIINCMPDLMRRTRMGKLDASKIFGAKGKGERETDEANNGQSLVGAVGSWVGRQTRRSSNKKNGKNGSNGHGQYLKYVNRLPGLLRFVPGAGKLRDVKNYLNIFCYFLQPTPSNIRSMILYTLREYVSDERLQRIDLGTVTPEQLPSVAIYHPDATKLFETFEEYRDWYTSSPKSKFQSRKFENETRKTKDQRPKTKDEKPAPPGFDLSSENTIGLLLMRPQVISQTTKHYDALIRAIEAEGLSVIPALSTLMDNREAVAKFFVEAEGPSPKSKVQSPKSKARKEHTNHQPTSKHQPPTRGNEHLITDRVRVSQIVSLTGFSFVGGPAMNDSHAASEFLKQLNLPYRSAVSLDTQTIDGWRNSSTGLNPVQAGMQIAIPEIDGATEPFIYGGIPANGVEPVALDERCARFARRLRRWNRLRTSPRGELKLAVVLFCFPPNKGNIGTAADLDVFPSVFDLLRRLRAEGYTLEVPKSADALREMVIGGNSERFRSTANIAYSMSVEEYMQLCPYVSEVEAEWEEAPGKINSVDDKLGVQGVHLGNIFLGVQPTFGYEGDPMRLLMARGGAPHHGFMAFYTYLSRVLNVDAAIHFGTHGSLEFMPGKQVGLSEQCWPDRLIGELPNLYVYSVNNPSEGSIAKRRSYAELISYLTPPIENAGLYKDFTALKDLVNSYREAREETEREKLYQTIEEVAGRLNLRS